MTAVQEQQRVPQRRPRQDGSAPAERRRILAAPVRALREAPRRPLAIATGAALFSLLAYAIVRHFAGTSMVDMIVYRAEGSAVAHNEDLYALRVTQWNLPATYPPFAAMLFVPTAYVGVSLLRVLITTGNLVLLGLLAHFSFRLVGWPRRELRPIGVILVTGFGVWLEPVFTTLRYGQINLALACLILWDLTRPDGRRSKGVAIGIAAGIKLTPGLFAVYLLITGRVRAAFVAGFAFLGTFLIGALVLPDATYGFWTKYLYDSSRVGRTEVVDNQSVRGAAARLMHTADPGTLATLIGALVALAGLATAAWAYRSDRWLPRSEAWGVCTAAVTAVLVSPISWTHHWVWCVPMLVLLAAEAAHERSRPAAVRRARWRPILGATLLAFLSFAMWIVPHKGELDRHLPALHQAPASIYPLVGLGFLAVSALRVHSRRRAAGAPLVRLPRQRTDSVAGPATGAAPEERQQAPAAR
ncbi:glycosyltransferase 87 family protein [Kitasatospora sp. GP82]|uniref:glycosyltransferase 87 family protein n=1 Tax=Kitasatospora sp. GP82 TaxID=3035089 RepID=UPI0024771074|nr:glycosyltransferase 87 family protein [Kitasatospora sp. GP82]MDH6126665.1 alpha-1,2-mannosyltransferase [Kitasatospora sp. GP82]